ncbi:P-loop containing nucleoside triphosphate hydrolase protein [Leucogyrophana mollusca]|uniref:P-loop containing nucleoside triphosphate hydrolase protein n=1 Tax=Leucogyrophana mollusca TaxID=85980 RepID=A0ACB8BSF1_9AGAM|nr:P-loop containing nucleoside triphosphate hydrolase protein [Leucogyrophana mollusca]
MNHVREKYNARARQSTAGSRKKGKRRVAKVSGEIADVNATIHVPKTKDEKERERKERLVQELAAQSESKMSSKKKKRLEKYIDKKLRKEERILIFEKLAQTQAQIPSLNLQSSSTLGTGKVSTNRERQEKLEDKEVRRVIEGRAGKRKRRNDAFTISGPNDSGSDGEGDELHDPSADDEGTRGATTSPPLRRAPVTIIDASSGAPAILESASRSTTVGGALKRNPDGTVVAPRMVKKKEKGKKTAFRSWKHKSSANAPVEEDSDTSFDSSHSAYDSDEEQQGDEDSRSSEESSSESANDSGDDSPSEEKPDLIHKKQSGFKDWAIKQLNAAKGYAVPPDADPTVDDLQPQTLPPKKKRKVSHLSEMRGPLGEDLNLPATSLAEHLQLSKQSSGLSPKRTKAVSVTRPPDVEEARIMLPIVSEEQPIMEAILLNPVVIICGETGSGKTTQVPQFLYEAGFGGPNGDNPGMIGITQPRRVAAMSMAARVSQELSLTSSRVSYQIRYDATVSPSTTIKFMTDGVLLRELATDFLLTKYSVIIIDEAHERSMNTDILIGVLSRVLKLREKMWKDGKEGAKPLRLIIMSATLRVSDFAQNRSLFSSPPPVINVSARQHPVTVHFNRRTPSDYVNEAIKKASKIHARLPPGGILIFLTGQNEIAGVCKKLEARFGRKALEDRRKRRQIVQASAIFEDERESAVRPVAPAEADVEAEEVELGAEQDLAFDVDDDNADEDPEALDSDDELNEELGLDLDESDTPMHIIPLYSLLPSDKQMRVFEAPPTGHRLVVVSTNVAETSLTIPGIRYVIDSGRAKERRYDVTNGIQSFQVNWTSKASAAQRAGRAGRTGPGHCYRLYSSALFEHYFDAFSQPEILRTPIEGVVLQMKSMNIDAVVNFPFPTPPDGPTLRKAEATLTHLGALSSSALPSSSASNVSMSTIGGHITTMGKAMSLFPLSPRYSKMLVSGQQHGCLPYIISIVSALSVGDPFLREEGLDAGQDSDEDMDEGLSHIKSEIIKAKEARRARRRAFFESQTTHSSLGKSSSDVFRILSVVGAYEYAGGGHQFCTEHFVRPKAMEEIHKLRAQISNIVEVNFPGVDAGFASDLRPPSDKQIKVLRQLLAAAFIDQVAARKDLVEKRSSSGVKFATANGVPYRAMGISEDVFIHPSSVLANGPPPDYIVFHEIVRTNRPWLKGLTVINPAWLPTLGKPTLCTFSKPAKNTAGTLMAIPRFGPDGWELAPVKAET